MSDDETVLVLTTYDPNSDSLNKIAWPESGPVDCRDWDANPKHGRGMPRGVGTYTLLDGIPGALGSLRWVVVRVKRDEIDDVKNRGHNHGFDTGVVVYSGLWKGAFTMLSAAYPEVFKANAVVDTPGSWGVAIVGDRGSAAAPQCYGSAVAGNAGTALVGDRGVALVGDHGRALAGERGWAYACDHGVAVALSEGRAEAGAGGWATVGGMGRATVGVGGTAKGSTCCRVVAGDRGTAEAEAYSHVVVGIRGRARVGKEGLIQVGWLDRDCRRRTVAGRPGLNGILADTWYEARDGYLVPVETHPRVAPCQQR